MKVFFSICRANMGDDWDEEVAAPVSGDVDIAATADLPEIKLFGRWSCDEVNVSDMSLQVSKLNAWREPKLFIL